MERPAHRMDRRMDSATASRVAGKGVHSSNAMVMSASSIRWISTDRSGVSVWAAPSTWERNRTPFSSTLRRFASDIT